MYFSSYILLLENQIYFACRLEKEIEALEKEEMKISANEAAILKKLKSVERTAEDIIKVSPKIISETRFLTRLYVS